MSVSGCDCFGRKGLIGPDGPPLGQWAHNTVKPSNPSDELYLLKNNGKLLIIWCRLFHISPIEVKEKAINRQLPNYTTMQHQFNCNGNNVRQNIIKSTCFHSQKVKFSHQIQAVVAC